MSIIDPFELLGLSQSTCNPEEARAAFAGLVLLTHPDKGGRASDMRVVTSAYRYVKRCMAARAAMTLTFREYYEEFDDGSEYEKVKEACGTGPSFDVEEFNRAFESRNPHLVYVGPAEDEPTEGPPVSMAAAGAGSDGAGYGRDIEAGGPLVQNQLAKLRESPLLLAKIVPEKGPRTLGLTDYAEAFAPCRAAGDPQGHEDPRGSVDIDLSLADVAAGP